MKLNNYFLFGSSAGFGTLEAGTGGYTQRFRFISLLESRLSR